MSERWRSSAARDLVKAARKAGGTVERVGVGRLKVTGPKGSVTFAEPGGETRRDLRRDALGILIAGRTGLDLS